MKILNKNKNFLGISGKYSSFEKSKVVIVSAPLEMSVSYGKGTKYGPEEILKASHYVELYDEELEKEICFDLGVCTLEEINFKVLSHKKSIKKINKLVSKILDQNKFVVTLGGEHSLSVGAIAAYSKKYKDLSILQVDAHSDLRDTYENSKYSHASVMARVNEFNKNIVQVGIRAQCKEEKAFIKKNNINTFYMHEIRSGKYGNLWQEEVKSRLTKNVYITFDVDGFDPSMITATGTPEPGGLFWDETMLLLKLVGKYHNIVGCDIVELAPSKFHSVSNYISAKLVYKIINYAFQENIKIN